MLDLKQSLSDGLFFAPPNKNEIIQLTNKYMMNRFAIVD